MLQMALLGLQSLHIKTVCFIVVFMLTAFSVCLEVCWNVSNNLILYLFVKKNHFQFGQILSER